MSGIVRRNTTLALVSFFRNGGQAFNRIDAYDAEALAVGAPLNTPIVSIHHTKALGGTAAGSVTITMKGYITAGLYAGSPWSDFLDGGDWWSIDIIKNGVYQGLSFGVIDSVALSVSAGATGAGEVLVTVSGRDIGFALDDTPLYFNPLDPTIDNALGINMLKVLDALAGKPHEVVIGMVKGLMGGLASGGAILGGHTLVPYGLAGNSLKSYWIDHVDLTTAVQTDLRGHVFAAAAITPQGAPSVWAFVDGWRNPAMNELYVDPKPTSFKEAVGKEALIVFREKPFVNATDGLGSPWFKLRTWYLDASTIASIQLAKGANRINHIAVTGDLTGIGQDSYGLYPPVAHLDSIGKFGVKRLEENVRYFDDSGESGFATDSKDWLNLIVAWHCLNHAMWSGTIEIAELRAEIRVGQKIAIVSGPPAHYPGLPAGGVAAPLGAPVDPACLTFYIESVEHTFTDGPQPMGRTVLTVSYGYVEGDRVPDVAAEVAKFVVPVGPDPGGSNTGEINVQPVAGDRKIDPGDGGASQDGDLIAEVE